MKIVKPAATGISDASGIVDHLCGRLVFPAKISQRLFLHNKKCAGKFVFANPLKLFKAKMWVEIFPEQQFSWIFLHERN